MFLTLSFCIVRSRLVLIRRRKIEKTEKENFVKLLENTSLTVTGEASGYEIMTDLGQEF